MRAPSPRSSWRCCAGRARGPASTGLAQALATFRATKETLHRSDPRRPLTRCRARRRAGAGRARSTRRWRRWKRSRRAQPFAAIAALHAQALEALVVATTAKRCRVRRRRRREARAKRSRRSPSSAAIFAIAPADYAELFETAIADRVCRRAGRPGARVRISARSKRGSSTSIAWCSAGWSKASGRRRRAAIPG